MRKKIGILHLKMNSAIFIKVIIPVLLIIFSFFIVQFSALIVRNESNISNTVDQGAITLFSQNYSNINNVPDNVFITTTKNYDTFFDTLYSTAFGNYNSNLVINNTSMALTYTTTKESSVLHNAGSLIEYNDYFGKYIIRAKFCRSASLPSIHCLKQSRQTGSVYISDLVPMVKSTYQILMNMKTDSPGSFFEIISSGSKLIIYEKENEIVLNSYYMNPSGDIISKNISIDNASETIKISITFDGINKTNTIFLNDNDSIITPFYKIDRQLLPYPDFSGGYIKITSYVIGKGTYFDLNIFKITQTAKRNLITAIGSRNIQPYGIDGPHPRDTVEKGIALLESNGGKGTIWVDSETIAKYNETYVEYIRNLIKNNSWELGIHYSKQLNKLPIDQAYKVMDEEYAYVHNKIGFKPRTWCSLRNDDNIDHVIYAFDRYGMIWRNGDAGINAETEGGVSNLDDGNWIWWKTVSKTGMKYPVFTHRTDENTAIKFSISFPKLEKWINNYISKNSTIVPFYDYWQINSNTYYAYFDNIEYNKNNISFHSNTNGYNTLINVNIISQNNTKVYDNNAKKFVDFNVEKDKSVTFTVENAHNYIINI